MCNSSTHELMSCSTHVLSRSAAHWLPHSLFLLWLLALLGVGSESAQGGFQTRTETYGKMRKSSETSTCLATGTQNTKKSEKFGKVRGTFGGCSEGAGWVVEWLWPCVLALLPFLQPGLLLVGGPWLQKIGQLFVGVPCACCYLSAFRSFES